MKKVSTFLFFVILFVAISSGSGCSPGAAMRQPDKKDMNVLTPGTHRDLVIVELGSPMLSGKDYDVFAFIQGYGKGIKAARAITHAILDIGTLGLWEIFGTPIEGAATGEKIRVKVYYNSEQCVVRYEKLEIPQPREKEEEKK